MTMQVKGNSHKCCPVSQASSRTQQAANPQAANPAAPEEAPSVLAEGAVGAPSAMAEGILPLSPLALNPVPLTFPSQLNIKKGAGVFYYSGVNEALKSARLSWTYNWWHTLSFVSTSLPPFVSLLGSSMIRIARQDGD